MGAAWFWLLILAAVFFFGGCGRGLFRGGAGCAGPRWPETGGGSSEPPETPKQILDRRLASGEITIEEYRRILQELSDRG